jgi:hypothetical protein
MTRTVSIAGPSARSGATSSSARARSPSQLERGHDREAAAAAANRPEELGVGLGVDAADRALGVDDLGGEDRVRRETVLACEPAETAAERVAEHADVVGRACERSEAVRGSRVGDLLPDDAGLDACAAVVRVDVDAAHACRPQEDRAREVADRSGGVAGPLWGDAQALGARCPDRVGDIGCRLGRDDGHRALVGGEVPRGAGLVPAVVAGTVEVAVEMFGEGVERGGCRVAEQVGHR